MARRTLLLIASILTAALGTALIWLYVQGADTRGIQNADLVPAVFLTTDVRAGDPPSALTTKYVSRDAAAGAVKSAAEIGQRRLNVPAKAGQLLLQSMLSNAAQAKRFPDGGAISVSIAEPNRVPVDLAAGDTVDIYQLTNNEATLLLSNITVRSIGTQTGAPAGAPPAAGAAAGAGTAVPATIVGVNVDARQAKTLYDVVASGGGFALYLHDPTS